MQSKGKNEIARGYVKDLNQIAEKSVVRLASSIKTKFCKKCSNFITWDYKEIKEKSRLAYIEGQCSICKKSFKNILTSSINVDKLNS